MSPSGRQLFLLQAFVRTIGWAHNVNRLLGGRDREPKGLRRRRISSHLDSLMFGDACTSTSRTKGCLVVVGQRRATSKQVEASMLKFKQVLSNPQNWRTRADFADGRFTYVNSELFNGVRIYLPSCGTTLYYVNHVYEKTKCAGE